MTWVPSEPTPSTEAHAFPPCPDDDTEDLEIHDLRIVGASALDAVTLERPEVVGVVLDGCDVAGMLGRAGRVNGLAIRGSRLRAVSWVNGIVQDTVFDTVTGTDVSFRFSTLRRVLFRDCALPGLDLTDVTLETARFERCDLQRAVFDGARMKAVRFVGCDLAGCTGAGALNGASVHPDDLLSLGPSLATALGLTVEE
jgi:uncharacterized protein YjbI with pentapeptide repeats